MAGYPNFAAEQPGNFAADRQTETGASVFAAGSAVGLLKRLKDYSLRLGGNSDAGIADGKRDNFAGAVQRIEKILLVLRRWSNLEHDVAFFGKLERVGKQVHEYLLQTLLVRDQD